MTSHFNNLKIKLIIVLLHFDKIIVRILLTIIIKIYNFI